MKPADVESIGVKRKRNVFVQRHLPDGSEPQKPLWFYGLYTFVFSDFEHTF